MNHEMNHTIAQGAIHSNAFLSRQLRLPAAMIAAIFAAGIAQAADKPAASSSAPTGSTTQNVNVVNTPTINVGTLPPVTVSGTPTVNVGTLPAVTLSGTPTVNLGNTPAVTISGTPTVNANVSFPANQTVTVSNTSANPASVLSADKATRIPYQSNQIISTCSGLQNCVFPVFTACPAGYRLVVENVSGFFNLQMNSTPISGYLENFHLPNQNFWGLNAPIGGTGFNAESFAGLNQNMTAVFDAGESPFVVIYGNFLSGFNQAVNVSGYLENCSVVGCPAVQH